MIDEVASEAEAMNIAKHTDLIILTLLVGAISVGMSLAPKPAQSSPTASPSPGTSSTPGASPAARALTVPGELMLRLPLNGSVIDEGPLHLECSANAVTFDDAHGGCANFGSGSYIKVSHPERFNQMESFTLAAWICPSKLVEHSNVISKVQPNRDFNLQMAHTGQLVAHIANPDYEHCVSKRQLQVDQWVHVAATYSDHQWRLYLDGRLDNSLEVKRGPGWTGDSLTIGNLLPNSSENFWGKLDEVRIYRGAMSADAISALSQP